MIKMIVPTVIGAFLLIDSPNRLPPIKAESIWTKCSKGSEGSKECPGEF